jgi:predicted ATPase/class 3 adenylate cyclase
LLLVTAPVIDLEGQVVGRHSEFAQLEESLELAGRAGRCVVVSGPPGVGKSTLVQEFGAEVARRGGVFAYGRYREGARAPYSAVGDALDTLVRAMRAQASGERERWHADLMRGLPALVGSLGALVPSLAAVLGTPPSLTDLVHTDGRHRLQRAALHLLAVTAAYRPVVLAVDDLQWADRDSLLLLVEIRAAALRNVVLVGAHRTGEFERTGLVSDMAEAIDIALRPLTVEDLRTLLMRTCGRSGGVGAAADEFYRRTGGNPLRIRQLLRQAQRQGALGRGDPAAPVAWNLAALVRIEITSDEAQFLVHAVEQLRPDAQAVLSAVACIGREFDLADAIVAADCRPELVGQALWSALDLRLLDAVDGSGRRVPHLIDHTTRYRFSHDRIAETARGKLTDAQERAVHLRIGVNLLGRPDDTLFDAARHLGIGGQVADGYERKRFAEVELRAAARAREQASFPLALECCSAGIALLGDRRWAEHFDLARELQLAGAEAAFLVSDIARMDALLDEAEAVLHDPADRGHLAYLRLKGQVADNRIGEAIATGRRALQELGEPLPRAVGRRQALEAVVGLKVMARRWSNERLLALPTCADRRIAEIHLIMGELRSMCYSVQPDLFPVIVRKQVELTMAHGLVESSPVALVSVGVLFAVLGDHVGCQRFGEVGLALAERPAHRDAKPYASFLYLNFIHHWRHPLQTAVPRLRATFQDAMSVGDPEYAGYTAVVLLSHLLVTGRPAPEVDVIAQSIIPQIRSQQVPASLARCIQQLCLNAMGRSADPQLLAGESGYDERVVRAAAERERDSVAIGMLAICKMTLLYWHRDYAGALRCAEETGRHNTGLAGTTSVHTYELINALIRVAMAPDARSTRRAMRRSLLLHRRWAATAPANYAAPYALLRGVWAAANGDLRRAERYLDQAVALAEQHGLSYIHGIAREEAAALYARIGRTTLSRMMLRSAYEQWLWLGVHLRAADLERTHPWLLGPAPAGERPIAGDRAGLHRLASAMSSATTPERLFEVLLGAVIDLTGADRALLCAGEAAGLRVHAVYADGQVTIVDALAPDVRHDRQAVVEAARNGHAHRRASDGSTLALAVCLRGHTIGVVAAELRDPRRTFAPPITAELTALCAQAAAPLWNVELEGRLLQADEQNRSLIDAQSRFIPTELLRILDVDDIRRVRTGRRVERRMTVLISDIRGWSTLLEDMSVVDAGDLATGFIRTVELPIITSNGLLQDVRGDEVLALFGTVPDDAVSAGLAILRSLRDFNRERAAADSPELNVGVGVNTGVIGVGMVGGVNRMALTVIGDAVNLASRIEGTTKRYGSALLISDITHAGLVEPDRFAIRRMETALVVNRRTPVTIYEVYDEDPEPLRTAKRSAQEAFDAAFALLDAGEIKRARAAFAECAELLPGDQVAPLNIARCDAIARGELDPGQAVALDQK